jgi:hypothetical protein
MSEEFIKWNTSDMFRKHRNIKLRILNETKISGDELSEMVENATYPYVPFLHGSLERSFRSRVLTSIPLLRIRVQYSAISNDYFDYSESQHEDDYEHIVRKPGKKPQRFFLRKGMFEVQQDVEEVYARRVRSVLS